MKIHLVLALAGLLSLTACTEKKLTEGKSSQASTAEAPAELNGESEAVDRPANITGSYLTCAMEIAPTADAHEFLVGCRFEDETGKKKDRAAVAEEIIFSYDKPQGVAVTVQVKELKGNARYEAAYLLIATSEEQALKSSQDLGIKVSVKNPVGGPSGTSFVGGKLSKISKKSEDIPEAREPDLFYTELRQEMISDFQNGELTPPLGG